MNTLDVVFLLITQELLIDGRGVLELREYTHLSWHFVHRLNTVLLGLVVVIIIITTTIISSYFVLSSYKGLGLCMYYFLSL